MKFSSSILGLLSAASTVLADPKIEVYFSPKGGCTEAVVDALANAKSTVLVQAYSFTSAPIARALTDAHKRGVKVQVMLDKSNRTDKYSAATFMQNYGIPTFIDDRHAIAHNKIMIIDGKTVLTGSFNFTKQAEESNAENLLVIDDGALAAKYTQIGRRTSRTASPTSDWGIGHLCTGGECPVKPLSSEDQRHVEAAKGWLILGNAIGADAALENITHLFQVHPDVVDLRSDRTTLAFGPFGFALRPHRTEQRFVSVDSDSRLAQPCGQLDFQGHGLNVHGTFRW